MIHCVGPAVSHSASALASSTTTSSALNTAYLVSLPRDNGVDALTCQLLYCCVVGECGEEKTHPSPLYQTLQSQSTNRHIMHSCYQDHTKENSNSRP